MKDLWQETKQIVEHTLHLAKKHGATAAEAHVSVTTGLSCTVRLREVETIEFNKDKYIELTVYKGQKKGTVSSSDFTSTAMQDIAKKACDIADHTEEDQYAGLVEREQMAKDIPDLNLYHCAEVSIEQAIQKAKECEQVALDFDARIVNSEGANFTQNQKYWVYGNTNDFLAGVPSSKYSLTCAVIAREDNFMQRDHEYTVARDIQDLQDYKSIGNKVAQKTLARLGARKIKTCKAPVLFSPDTAKDVFNAFISAITGNNLYKKASFLLDSLQQQVFPDFIEIKENPRLLKAIGSAPFDREGVATNAKDIIQNGILKNYLLNSYSARKLNMTTTGNAGGVFNLVVKPGDKNFNELIATMDHGLAVTELIGFGINLATGDYSKGAVGFWVENGKIQYPVEGITIAGNLKDMFMDFIEVGNDIDYRNHILTGSLLIKSMTIAGD